MSKKDSRDLSQSIRNKLLYRSKQKQVDFNNEVTRYALDRFLYRLGQSEYKNKFILKGATLFKVWNGELHRPTKDLDLLGFGESDISEIEKQIKAVCKIQCEDGIDLYPQSVRGEIIKEDQEYEGIRIYIKYALAKNTGNIQIDIGFGDEITPEPLEIEIPTDLDLDLPVPYLRIYPRETIVAEKFQAMVSLGISNSRMKDFYDILFLSRNFEFNGQLLKQAIEKTFKRRKTSISDQIPLALTDEFIQDTNKQKAWQAFLNKINIKDGEEDFGKVIEELQHFLIPPYFAISSQEVFEKLWLPDRKKWELTS